MNKRETIQAAIQAEIMSQNLYKHLAKSFTKPEASSVFLQLVPQEELHEAKLRELYNAEFAENPMDLDLEKVAEVKQMKITEPKQALEYAISREEMAQNIYLKLAEESFDAATKAMLLKLATEEDNHKTILFTEIQRLQGMLEWFDPSELNGFMED